MFDGSREIVEVSDDRGGVNFVSATLNAEYELAVEDPSGRALAGIEVSYREVAGTPLVVVSDPLGRYRTRVLLGSPEVLAEMLDGEVVTSGLGPPVVPQIEPVTLLVIGVVVLAVSTTAHVMSYMEAAEEVELQLEDGVLDCGTDEVVCLCKSPSQVAQLRDAQFERDAAVTDIVFGFFLFGLSGVPEAGKLIYKTWGLATDLADVPFNSTVGDLIQDLKYGARESDTWGGGLDENQPYITYLYDFTDDQAKKQLLTFMTDESCDPTSEDRAAQGGLQLEGFSGSMNQSQLAASFSFVLEGLPEGTPVRVDVLGDDGTTESYELQYELTYDEFPELGHFQYLTRRSSATRDRVFVTVPDAYLAQSTEVEWVKGFLPSIGYRFTPESPATLKPDETVEVWWDWEIAIDRPYETCLEGDAEGASCRVSSAAVEDHSTTFQVEGVVRSLELVWREAKPPHRQLASTLPIEVDFSEDAGVYTAQELAYFEEIAVGAEYGGNDGIARWEGEVRLEVLGSPTSEDLEVLDALVATLNDVMEVASVRLTSLNANARLYFVPVDDFSSYVPTYVPGNDGFFWYSFVYRLGPDGEPLLGTIYDADILVGSDRPQLVRNHLILEEVTQSLGLANDSWEYPESIFYQGFTTTQTLAPIDVRLVEMLYREELSADMSTDDVLATLENLDSLALAAGAPVKRGHPLQPDTEGAEVGTASGGSWDH